MVLGRDIPYSALQRRILVAGLLVLAVIGVVLFAGFLPGLRPNYSAPTVVTLNGHPYFDEVTPLHAPFFSNASTPWSITFHNVTFDLWLSNWYSPTGGIVHVRGTELNGSESAFEVGQLLPNGTRAALGFSSDSVFGVWWTGGWSAVASVQLLVETSYGEAPLG